MRKCSGASKRGIWRVCQRERKECLVLTESGFVMTCMSGQIPDSVLSQGVLMRKRETGGILCAEPGIMR